MAGGGSQTYSPTPQATPGLTAPLSREEAEMRIEAQRRLLEQQGSSVSRLLPPTKYTPPPAPK